MHTSKFYLVPYSTEQYLSQGQPGIEYWYWPAGVWWVPVKASVWWVQLASHQQKPRQFNAMKSVREYEGDRKTPYCLSSMRCLPQAHGVLLSRQYRSKEEVPEPGPARFSGPRPRCQAQKSRAQAAQRRSAANQVVKGHCRHLQAQRASVFAPSSSLNVPPAL